MRRYYRIQVYLPDRSPIVGRKVHETLGASDLELLMEEAKNGIEPVLTSGGLTINTEEGVIMLPEHLVQRSMIVLRRGEDDT